MRPSAVSTVPRAIGTTSSVVSVRLPRNRPRILYAIGTETSTLRSAAGTPRLRVVRIVSRRYGSEKKVW